MMSMKQMIRGILGLYGPAYPATIVYMLQSTEYQIGAYLLWYWRTQNFSAVAQRRQLDKTTRARLLVCALSAAVFLQVVVGAWLIFQGVRGDFAVGIIFGVAVIISYPVTAAHAIVVPMVIGQWLIVRPRQRRMVKQAEKIFGAHPAAKMAIAGSYGKTSMKELLSTVLGEGLKVAATPGNKNVEVSHAVFASSLQGDEAVLIIEYGEGKPGDVAAFARMTHPTHAIITGLAPAHLDSYKTIENAGEDVFSVTDYVSHEHVYVNKESSEVVPFLDDSYHVYGRDGIQGWKVRDIALGLEGTRFTLRQGKTELKLSSGLLGRHQIGPLSVAAVLGLELGLTTEQVQAGASKTRPYEHRMQPYALGRAWVIDDTYNGNLEGIRAGTELLSELPAKRKWYVTPGLVDQGKETASIHHEVGRLIAAAKPDVVVLMENSVAGHIKAGLDSAGYTGELRIEPNPLNFYTNLEHFLAAGDLVLMQNDWTDNYA